MSYIGLGQSQSEEGVMEVFRPSQHFNRWGPVSGFGQLPPLPDVLEQFVPGAKPPVAPQTTMDKLKNAAPIIIAGTAVLGLLWNITTTRKKGK